VELKTELSNLGPATKPRVPHISLVFREMWDTTAFDPRTLELNWHLSVEMSGIPHLAKNKRDVGHPTILGTIDRMGSYVKLKPQARNHVATLFCCLSCFGSPGRHG
jgi:hypothetical protein